MKRPHRPKINWTNEMLKQLIKEFPIRFNSDLSKEMNISERTLIRKARALGIDKCSNFREINIEEIKRRTKKNRPLNDSYGVKGWCVPNSEKTRFKPGHTPATKNNPELVKRITEKRNKTIESERRRIMFGLKQLTKLNLK